jgi:hypothetical protein
MNLGTPLFVKHIRALTDSTDSGLDDVQIYLLRSFLRYLCRYRRLKRIRVEAAYGPLDAIERVNYVD